jgi:hypothetical protein
MPGVLHQRRVGDDANHRQRGATGENGAPWATPDGDEQRGFFIRGRRGRLAALRRALTLRARRVVFVVIETGESFRHFSSHRLTG